MEPAQHTVTTSRASARGSALILAVVLTSLLAIVGVLFVLGARIDKMASSATTDNRELSLAVDTVLAQINDTLVRDVPGVGTNNGGYYDYPDANNAWLANAEPYALSTASGSKTEYYWRQISSIVGPALPATGTRDVHIRLVGEREPINLTDPNTNADPDGDGVGDARWFRVPGIMSSRGQPLYAAVRILDNCGMLNVNTGSRFDSTEQDPNLVNGRDQSQINVLALGKLGSSAKALSDARGISPTAPWPGYVRQVIWRYPGDPDPNLSCPYTPFDLSDELELRYRYIMNRTDIDTRLEVWGHFRDSSLSTPVDSRADLGTWFRRVAGDGLDPSYAFCTVATTYNADRILLPREITTDTGAKLRRMVNVNRATESELRAALGVALAEAAPNDLGVPGAVLQIAANLLDYLDDDDEVTVISGGSSNYYGFERPCLYLSEIAYRQVKDPDTGELHASYAVELFRPYFEDRDPKPGDWKLVINNPTTSKTEIDIAWSGSRRFHVLLAEDAAASLQKDYVQFVDGEEPSDTMPLYGYDRSAYARTPQDLGKATLEAGATISLQRRVASAAGWITVDYKRLPENWIQADGVARSLQRDISAHKCVRRIWAPDTQVSTPGLGNAIGNYVDVKRPEVIQAHPANRPLTNIGELGMVFAWNAYGGQEGWTADQCLVNLRHPLYRKLCNHLTVIDPWDPAKHPGVKAGETRILGRVNVNTAPAFVLAQLPWMQYGETPGSLLKAKAIVRYRDGLRGPYRSIGDLMQVDALCSLGGDSFLVGDGLDNQHNDTPRGPDLTPDTARDDLEERDLIFTRISNLVTVRSDVFTAYILVRIGTSGPQKRVLAILDRSQVNSAGDRVRLAALYPVPDPR